MKKIWTKPVAIVEQFAANEYVAACGDSNTVYKFKCNAPAGTLYYYPTSDGKIDGYNTTGTADRVGSFTPCPTTHEAETTGDFYDGFIDYNHDGKHSEGEGVIVYSNISWAGFIPYRNYHATKELDMNQWETAKS